MNVEVIAIGNAEIIKDNIKGYSYINENDIFVVSIPSSYVKTLIYNLNTNGVKAFLYNQYLKILQTNQKLKNINKIEDNVYEWIKTGLHYFYCNYSNSFELFSLDKKDVKSVSKIENISKCQISNNGAIYGFIKGELVNFYIGDSLKLVIDLKMDDIVEDLEYNQDDSIVAVKTSSHIYFYDIFKGKKLALIEKQPFAFVKEGIYFEKIDRFINDYSDLQNTTVNSVTDEIKSFSVYKKDKIARFENNRNLQKIIFNDSGKITSKTQTYVKKIEFLFAEKRLFALITKNISGSDQFIIESYCDGEITLNIFENKFINVAVSDSMLIVQDSTHRIYFYIKERYTFRLHKKIKKTGPVLISAKNNVCVIYDENNSLIEYYDKGNLRSAFNQDKCTNISWCENGLYVATYSCSENLGCMVQIFNNNGFLMFKKIFNSLKSFSWRGYPELDLNVKEEILKNNPIEEENETEEIKDKDDLLAEWKGYLLFKKQSLMNN